MGVIRRSVMVMLDGVARLVTARACHYAARLPVDTSTSEQQYKRFFIA
ncbi:hypothetical protein J5069_18230 [Candidatus Symbiopectobacterium sp. NZEC127]|nr:hypothetical protein [Candidatus Symbiopectobacterium sp. NZEC127]MCW2487839.1 hypothetical protein [Candidatus Symbiopectobacterium sp. NZEC127]